MRRAKSPSNARPWCARLRSLRSASAHARRRDSEGWYGIPRSRDRRRSRSDLRSGVELAVCLGQRVAELATIVLADVGQPEFLQAEDDLLHVSRRLSAEQSDHVTSSSVAERRSDFALRIEDRFAAWQFSRRAACRQWRPFRSWYR